MEALIHGFLTRAVKADLQAQEAIRHLEGALEHTPAAGDMEHTIRSSPRCLEAFLMLRGALGAIAGPKAC